MTRSRRSPRSWVRNFLAVVVAGGAIGIAQINSDPMSVGGQPSLRAASITKPTMTLPPAPSLPVRIQDGEDGEAQPAVVENPNTLQGIWAKKMVCSILTQGCDSFGKVPGYTASMFKQERLGGVMGEGQTIEAKFKHQPFSVYMKWRTGDRGRQLIYVEGQNEGNMLVQPGGIKGRLTGVISLDPEGTMALAESRYPVSNAGLLPLAQKIVKYQVRDIESGKGFHCELHDNQMFADRPCFLFINEYDSKEVSETYRKCVVYIDKELSMPVCVKNYTWDDEAIAEELDEKSIIEFYAYSDLDLESDLSAEDFDQSNRSYRLRVRR